MRTIRSNRLTLRPWEEQDAAFLFDLESRWETVRYLEPNPRVMTSLKDAEASITRRRALDHPVHGIWAITRNDTGAAIGNLLLKPVKRATPEGDSYPVEIGWHLHPDAQGNGFATEAAQATIDDPATRELEFVVAIIEPRNTASIRVCERLGFDLERSNKEFYDSDWLIYRKELSK
jgi:RimJ/RimL family protein N-acetyltransferase